MIRRFHWDIHWDIGRLWHPELRCKMMVDCTFDEKVNGIVKPKCVSGQQIGL
jgi:hypothetical protein